MKSSKISIGILAHVDAGKTTLSENMLLLSGKIRAAGRVDHGDTHLDTNEIERERGITVFSKQTEFTYKGRDFILLDTPGHIDFSTEAERVLGVLDCAIIVVSATDGVQNHTLTLWRLLESYRVPTFIFVNKTDLPNGGEADISERLSKRLDRRVFPIFTGESAEEFEERAALLSEYALTDFEKNGSVDRAEIMRLIRERECFPCYFGSALKGVGVERLLDGVCRLSESGEYADAFGARVYKITYDGNNRLTFLKLTGGVLNVRGELNYYSKDGKPYREKIAQIRRYSGAKFTQTDSASAGDVIAVTGLSATFSGQGLGFETEDIKPLLKPIISYSMKPPDGCDVYQFYNKIKVLSEEDPSLDIVMSGESREILVRLMGEIQTEVLTRVIYDRFGVRVGFSDGKIIYRETVAAAVEGVGHFEPLRHYAEVHLLIEPLPEGSGIVTDSVVPPNALDINWQRLIITSICEKTHRGVLIGAPLTDVKISVLAGRAHPKHTSGGDFREATYRAIRQGLMCAKSLLLEPYYGFRLEVPDECLGRAINDMQTRYAAYTQEASDGGTTALSGRIPASEISGYQKELASYSRGRGTLELIPDGYSPCHNAGDVIAINDYDPSADTANPPHSVFCAHGAGFTVTWDKVRNYMHVNSGWKPGGFILPSAAHVAKTHDLSEKDLEAIMLREFGPIKRKSYGKSGSITVNGKSVTYGEKQKTLLIDGYNLVFAWDNLKEIAEYDLEGARNALIGIIENYAAFTKTAIFLIFDAYKVKGGAEHTEIRNGVTLIFTAQDMTADTYIEKEMHRLGPDYSVRVVTSDRLIQQSAVVSGVLRMSAGEFYDEILKVDIEITEFINRLREENGG